MTGGRRNLFIVVALAAAACPAPTSGSKGYVVENPDPDLAAMADACRAMPHQSGCNDWSVACVSDPCIALCKRLMEIGGDGAYENNLTVCYIDLWTDAATPITVSVTYDL